MGTNELVLCIIVGHLITVQSVRRQQDALFPQDFTGVFENGVPLPLDYKFDFAPYDTIFSSWRTRTPDFHMLAELPPITDVPRVQVFCDESKLTLLVDKKFSHGVLTEEEVQLGDGCYSNRELTNRFIFVYSFDQCGTIHMKQNGLKMFTNSLHLNLKNPPPTSWRTPSTVRISCIPKRSYDKPNYFASPALPENYKSFNMKVMNPSWTSSAKSVYKRGQVVNLQVSTQPRPGQQLFIQSCFLSTSPDPQATPKHAVIMNKGCTALGSPHAAVHFVASERPDVVNFVLNTSAVISELYIHCSVLTSNQGISFGSKSCNYNVIHKRWEELSGDVEVCECCESKCKGLSVKNLSEDATSIVSTGLLVFVDKGTETSREVSESEETTSIPVRNFIQPDFSSETGYKIVSGTSISRSQSPLYPPTKESNGESVGELKGNTMWDQTFHTLGDALVVPTQLDSAVTVKRFMFGTSGKFGTEAPGMTVKNNFNRLRDELAQMQADAPDGTNGVQPIVHSKIQFSKGVDGSQTLSYEVEIKERSGKGMIRGCGMQDAGQKGLYSTFLDLMRRTNKAE